MIIMGNGLYSLLVLADRLAMNVAWSAIGTILSSVCLSVCPSVRPSFCDLCIVAKRYTLHQKCMNKWIGNALLRTRFYNFQPPISTLNPQTSYRQRV